MENRILSVGGHIPSFNKKTVVSIEPGKEFSSLSEKDIINEQDKWTVMFWWPKDFTFVCPTEISAFNDYFDQFSALNTQLIGASTDSEFVHLAWRNSHPDLKGLKFPMLADTSKSLAEDFGILEAEEKIAYRATYIIDPTGKIRWVNVNDLAIGRNIDEVLRVLEALQTNKLTPCNWKAGDETL